MGEATRDPPRLNVTLQPSSHRAYWRIGWQDVTGESPRLNTPRVSIGYQGFKLRVDATVAGCLPVGA